MQAIPKTSISVNKETFSADAEPGRILASVLESLRLHADPLRKIGQERYFKGTIHSLGIPMPVVLEIQRAHRPWLKKAGKRQVFALCDALWKNGLFEASIIACHWSRIPYSEYTRSDLRIFERWIRDYVSNWATCDTFCNHSVAMLLKQYPDAVSVLKKWARSDHRWLKRAAATSLIKPAAEGLFLEDILEISRILIKDTDDMVQKGYGWMLKEAYAPHPKALEDFVLGHASIMPRTAFRYAIEKWPPAKRKKAMSR